MNKTELINLVAKNTGITRKAAEVSVSATLEAIKNTLAAGEKVLIPGFGTFEVRIRAARNASNPRTKEKIKIPESKYVKFTASKVLKDNF